MGPSFVALDVETANADWSSICQVGAVRVQDGTPIATFKTLVDPQAPFDPWNVSIHGITEDDVQGAPQLPEVSGTLAEFVGAGMVVSHGAFDRVAVERAHDRYQLPPPSWVWLDTVRVARRAWLDRPTYRLPDVAEFCGIEFRHHDALEDARAAALILLRAVTDTGLDLDAWQRRVQQPIHASAPLARDGNPDGPLAGEAVAFTGSLLMTRSEAAAIAARIGCDVGESVTRKTTMLVVGLQDATKLAGYQKSSKHRKAEALMAAGQHISILSEDDFMALVGMHGTVDGASAAPVRRKRSSSLPSVEVRVSVDGFVSWSVSKKG
jgi:DNA polymerase-3 subunit epsilon